MHNRYPFPLDLQVNGYLGVDFSSPDLSLEQVVFALESLFNHGVGSCLPTVITSDISTYRRNLRLLAEAAETPDIKDRIPGLHAEGPFISSVPGAVGAHNPDWVRPASVDFLKQMQDWAGGHIRIVTLAAELPGAEAVTEYACEQGMTVFLGHQDASMQDLRRLARAGAKAITHLGNGMPNNVHRHNNILFYGLAVDELWATIIADGHHLPAHLIQTILRAKGIDKVVVTSDASPMAGMKPGRYEVMGNKAVLEENGLLHNPEKGCMVGSSATLVECSDFIRDNHLLNPEDLYKVTYENPCRLLGLTD